MAAELSVESLLDLFKSIGLDEKKAAEATKNKKITLALRDTLAEAGVCTPSQGSSVCDKTSGYLLYVLAMTLPKEGMEHRQYICKRIVDGSLRTESQLAAGVRYASRSNTLVPEVFNEECGIGVAVSREQIISAIQSVLAKHREELLAVRYAINLNMLLKEVRECDGMKWADGRMMKDEFDTCVLALLGPKTAQDEASSLNVKSTKKVIAAAVASSDSKPVASVSHAEEKATVRVFEGEVLRFHKPGENKQLNEEIMRRHLETTGGKVITRFPPEPNGFLHIGHAKAMNLNFKYAEANNGICILRYDDTNPEAEKQVYYDAIKDMVEWMGFKPNMITCASDYFHELYQYAVELIKRDKAYICSMTPEEIHLSRGGDEKGPRYDSPWRNRPIEESLRLFDEMRDGKYPEGAYTLRMKMDMQSENVKMWDPVAYRILYHPHVRTGTKWCIYPSYDFTHCINDSQENITHSLCTREFHTARESYYWLLDNLEVYKAVQWEYGRLSITNTILSKRKLIQLVEGGYVAGWDDPRLPTLVGCRRRGYSPRAINTFVEKLGITPASTTVDVRVLEACVRDDLNENAPRIMGIVDPLLVTVVDKVGDESVSAASLEHVEMIDIPFFPNDPSRGSGSVPFTRRLFIDRNDFREHDDPNYFRLAPGKSVGLFRAHVITCVSFRKDSESGRILEVFATCERNSAIKPKTYIQWVADCPALGSPMKCEVRMYGPLFKSKNPMEAVDGWLTDLNQDSLKVVKDSIVDVRCANAKMFDKYQFQRVGYFCVDPDSCLEGKEGDAKSKRLVFNLTVSLKEDPLKD